MALTTRIAASGDENGTADRALLPTELNNDERSAVQNVVDRARTRLGDLAGLAGYLKWPVFVGFSRTVNKPVD